MNTNFEVLKQNFPDCTYGGEDENYIMYDIGLNDSFAHVNLNKEKKEILVKVYDPEDDFEPICEEKFSYLNEAIDYLNLSTWRKVWNKRRKLTCADTKDKIVKWIDKHQKDYEEVILIDEHPKDGWVAYLK